MQPTLQIQYCTSLGVLLLVSAGCLPSSQGAWSVCALEMSCYHLGLPFAGFLAANIAVTRLLALRSMCSNSNCTLLPVTLLCTSPIANSLQGW